MSKIQKFNGDFIHQSQFTIRLNDLLLGAHLGNDKVLSLITEAHNDLLLERNASFEDVNGCILMVKNVNLEYKKEVMYKDTLHINIGISNISKYRVSLYFENRNQNNEVCQKALIDCVYLDRENHSLMDTKNILDCYKRL